MRVIESAAMQDVEGRSALIVGTGLAGSLLAVFLARAGWTVRLVERRHDPRELLGERASVVCDRRLQWAGWPLMPRAQFWAQHKH